MYSRSCCCGGCSSRICNLEEYQYEDTRSVIAGGTVNCPICAIGRTSARKQGAMQPAFQYASYLDAGEMKPMYSWGENEEFSEAMGPGAFRDYGIYGNHLKIGHPCMDRWTRILKDGHASPWFELHEIFGKKPYGGNAAIWPGIEMFKTTYRYGTEAKGYSSGYVPVSHRGDTILGVWNPFSNLNTTMTESLIPPQCVYGTVPWGGEIQDGEPKWFPGQTNNVWKRVYQPYEWLFNTGWYQFGTIYQTNFFGPYGDVPDWNDGIYDTWNDYHISARIFLQNSINWFTYNLDSWPVDSTRGAFGDGTGFWWRRGADYPPYHYVGYDLPNFGEDVTFTSEYVWAFQNSWSNACGFDDVKPYQLLHVDRGQREPGIRKLYPCDSNHAQGVQSYNVPTWYYETISPFGYLPFSPQFFDRWIHKFDGPLYPQGNCSMHCTQENINAHKLAFVGSIGTFYQGYHDGSNSKRCVGEGRKNNHLYQRYESRNFRSGIHEAPSAAETSGSDWPRSGLAHSRATRTLSPCDIIDFPVYQEEHWASVCSELGLPEEICNQNTIGFACKPISGNDEAQGVIRPIGENLPSETECPNCSVDSNDALVTIPPDPGENYENWEWIRKWVNSGGKLVVLYSNEDIVDEGSQFRGKHADHQGSKYWIKNSSFPKSCGSWLEHEDTSPSRGMQEPEPSPRSAHPGFAPYDSNTSYHLNSTQGSDYVDESHVEEMLYQFATYCAMSDEDFEMSEGALVPFYEGLCSQLNDDIPFFQGGVVQNLKEIFCGQKDNTNFHPNQYDWNNRRMKTPLRGYQSWWQVFYDLEDENSSASSADYPSDPLRPVKRHNQNKFWHESNRAYGYWYTTDVVSMNSFATHNHRSFNGPSFYQFFNYSEDFIPSYDKYPETYSASEFGGLRRLSQELYNPSRYNEELSLILSGDEGKQWPSYDYLGTHPYLWWNSISNRYYTSIYEYRTMVNSWFYGNPYVQYVEDGELYPLYGAVFNEQDRKSYLSSYFNFTPRDYPTFLSCQKTQGSNTTKDGKSLPFTSMRGGDPLFPIDTAGGKSLVGGNWKSFGGNYASGEYNNFPLNDLVSYVDDDDNIKSYIGDECSQYIGDCPSYFDDYDNEYVGFCYNGYCIPGGWDASNEMECSWYPPNPDDLPDGFDDHYWFGNESNFRLGGFHSPECEELYPGQNTHCLRGRCIPMDNWNNLELIFGTDINRAIPAYPYGETFGERVGWSYSDATPLSTANKENKLIKNRRTIEVPFWSDRGMASTVYTEMMRHDIWPRFMLEELDIVDSISQDACSVVYKQNGKGAVIVSYDPSSLGSATNFPDSMFTNELDYEGNARSDQEENMYEFIANAEGYTGPTGDAASEQMEEFARKNPTNFYGSGEPIIACDDDGTSNNPCPDAEEGFITCCCDGECHEFEDDGSESPCEDLCAGLGPRTRGLTPKERRKHAANNDFWTFICQDFLAGATGATGPTPDPEWFEEYDEGVHGPRFWDYKGPYIGDINVDGDLRLAYKDNPCLKHLESACCLPNGSCDNLNPWECAEQGGRWQGMRMMSNSSDAYVEDGGNENWKWSWFYLNEKFKGDIPISSGQFALEYWNDLGDGSY